MKIVFLTRVDAFDKNGGDTFQLLMYKKFLEEKGHSVYIENNLSIPLCMDFYILVNLDRPLELIIYYKELKKKKLTDKMLLLPIHHSYEHIEYFEKKIRDGISGTIFRVISGFHRREKFKNIIRGIKRRPLLKYAISHFFTDYKKITRSILNDSIAVILIAEDEKYIIEKDFNIKLKSCCLVKNGVQILELYELDKLAKERKIDIFVSGRIEPRKNSLLIAQFFKDKNYNVVFAGALNANSKKYCDEFCKIVNDSDNIKYVGRVESDLIHKFYMNSKIHLSASWFEVASLVDLESYAYGCHVISSKHGHTCSYLGDKAIYISPYELSSLDEKLISLLQKENTFHENYEFISSRYTWKKSSDTLMNFLTKL